MSESAAPAAMHRYPDADRIRRLIGEGFHALSRREQGLAERCARSIVQQAPETVDGWVLLARARQQVFDFAAMREHIARACALAPDRVDLVIAAAEASIANGDIRGARAQLAAAAAQCGDDVKTLHQLTVVYTQLGRHREAYDVARRLADSAGRQTATRFALSSAAIAVGRFEEAEQQLEAIIADDPDEAEAYYTRATLRRQTAASNHIDELEHRLRDLQAGNPAEVPLCYALGKECEDAGAYEKAFGYFRRGANARHRRLSYDVAIDTAALRDIAATFDEHWWQEAPRGEDTQGAIFICGLPRSGTTLVDRILASHPQVSSLGEINDFAYAVMRFGAPASGKGELMRRVADADMSAIGREYMEAIRGYGEPGPCLVDKTPGNVLYLGLIARALPRARIVHVHRHPMAAGYAMYKTLFRMGYPFSYHLESIGQYWLAHQRLLSHWKVLFGERILDVSYEALIDDQEGVSRKIVAHCGLDWSEDCLRFHENRAPTATASAVQVRQPLYGRARDLWRRYETELAPLRRVLVAGGAEL